MTGLNSAYDLNPENAIRISVRACKTCLHFSLLYCLTYIETLWWVISAFKDTYHLSQMIVPGVKR
jgi:hypothetical protein